MTFSDGITARYIRYHPMRGQSTQGATDSVNVRVNAMTCSEGEMCYANGLSLSAIVYAYFMRLRIN